jgi:hypothetical protein
MEHASAERANSNKTYVIIIDIMSYPQPTSLPTSLFVAPSIPEDISSQIIDPPLATSPPTTDSRMAEFSMHKQFVAEDSYAISSEIIIAIIGILVLSGISYFLWRK